VNIEAALAPVILNQSADHCTVNVAEFVTPPEFPPIAVVPEPLAVAKPATLGAFAIVATLADDELQWVVNVMSCVVPSLKEPVAMNCCVLPTVAVEVAGVIASETNVPVPTVNVAVPVTPDAVAKIVTVPLFFPCARPEPRMEAIFGFEDFQLNPLRFVAVLPSLRVPVAVNFSDVPFAILAFIGLTSIEVRCAVETVS
jgi:hypothetical protein